MSRADLDWLDAEKHPEDAKPEELRDSERELSDDELEQAAGGYDVWAEAWQ